MRRATSCGGSGPRSATISRSVFPGTSSMTMKASAPSLPSSNTVTTFGWTTAAARRASSAKRARKASSASEPRSLMATSRSSFSSRARHTSPAPPSSIRSMRRYRAARRRAWVGGRTLPLFSPAMPSFVPNLCANPSGELDESAESRLISSVASEDRELLTDELDDRRRRHWHRALPVPLAIEEDGRGLMARRGLASHHELGLLSPVRGLDTDPPDIAIVEAPLGARPHPDHDRRAVGARDSEEQSAGLRRSERLERSPAETRREPSHEEQRLRGVDVTSIHVHGETDTEPGDTVQKEPPRRHVEERCRDLAPRGESRPVQVGEAEPSMRRLRDARDRRESDLGAREIRGVDDEPVGETQKIPERPRADGRSSGPPEKDREIGHEEGDHRGREPIVHVTARANEDLLIADLSRAIRDRKLAMHLDAALAVLAFLSAVRKHHDGARGMTESEVGDAPGRATRVLLAVGVHDEVEHRCAGDRADRLARMRALNAPEPRELALEGSNALCAGAPEHRVDHYAFRHFRPSRSMRSSASVGPQVPAP